MKIVVALDSFKGGLTAPQACRAVADGLRDAIADLELVLKPMADGGEGTARAVFNARQDARWVDQAAAGPFCERYIPAGFAWIPGEDTAIIDMASVNGLPLIPREKRDPMITSTYGTGQLLQAAANKGADRILLGIGGSSTVDGGTGAAAALGWKYLDEDGNELIPNGSNLEDVARIVPPDGPRLPPLTVLCDVTNPLCGPRGAARVYAPQKGASPAEVEKLEAGLENLARRIEIDLGKNVRSLPGGGASGGLGAGAVAFLGASLVPGIEKLIGVTGLVEALDGADWCLTGEGAFDRQSLDGKVVSGVAAVAQERGVPAVVLAGRVEVAPPEYRERGIRTARAIHDPGMPLEEAICQEDKLLRRAARRWALETIE